MTDVSCRAFSWFVTAERKGWIRLPDLLEGCPVPEDVLRDPAQRVPWDEWARLSDRFANLVGWDRVEETGSISLESDIVTKLVHVASIFTEPRDLLDRGVRWVGPATYRNLLFDVVVESPTSFLITVTIPEPYAPSLGWMLMARGAIRSLPNLIGLPDAVVRGDATPRRLAVHVTTAPSRGLRSGLGRILTLVRAPSALIEELAFQQTQMNESYETLGRLQRGFRSVLGALPAPVALHTAGRVEYANDALIRLLGVTSAAEVYERTIDHWVAEEDRPRAAALFDPSATPPSSPIELRLRRSDGELAWVEAAALHGVAMNAHVVSVLFAVDRTEAVKRDAQRQAMQEKLASNERMAALGTLAAGVAHELNNPLTWVITNLETVLEELDDEATRGNVSPDSKKRLDDALDGALRMSSIVRELRTLLVQARGREQEGGAAEPITVVRSRSPRTMRILVVDDEPALGRAVARALRGHEVHVVASGRDALSAIEHELPFDLVLCDLMMPEMTGMELHDVIAKEHPELRARMVFMTGGAFTPGAREFVSSTDRTVLEKPISVVELRALVDELMAEALRDELLEKDA
jgi:PAS domain S-box-containing protein